MEGLRSEKGGQIHGSDRRDADKFPHVPVNVRGVEHQREVVASVEQIGRALDRHPGALGPMPSALLLRVHDGQSHGVHRPEHAQKGRYRYRDVRPLAFLLVTQRVANVRPMLLG
eukprot:CAMPEP_0177466388 /NCGR_PEP_ID=MMETSP0369-20130122/17942_1 /TAXON_ID=447022 ORGANISM="Scrippsiella hangoei-like, Strain SHHI-4" /NCGR_SAMPLE_ID=MMETSP0369 /ASSEMBLY_ACC=CAM_ASM_000364 /LENGTH=113 /DNA_ID=CAMNT_0018940379 /DNA_START=299 /DNA_END=643 /DNA_ORIENTATION=+